MHTTLIEPFVLSAAAAITIAVAYTSSLMAAQSRHFLDHPNERSSHTQATPRIGGLAIMGGWVAGMFILGAFASNPEHARTAAIVVALAISAFCLGLMDDWFGLAAFWKFAGQIAIASVFVGLFGPVQAAPAPFFGEAALTPLWGAALSIFWIVAFMNAFNFMDGANGLAAGAAAVGLAWLSVIAAASGAPLLFVMAFLLALAATGFLPHNLNRGKIFMGDNGSQALGFLIAAFGVLGVNWTDGRLSALIAPLIFLPLIFDVAWTLVSRLIRRRNILKAHNEHLYQLMIRTGASHSAVAIIYMGLVAICASAALLMLTLPYSLQWLAPAAMAAIFGVGATTLYRRAYRKGLFRDTSENHKTENGAADVRPQADAPLRSAG
ncbi:glycosyltransferase family 4 protein [Hyphococcus sp.]|uniref:glycosyltransferase family 4 protein n=1 Tax=Hyphococcus sp. TaxID=2038636 RepID=UPI003CCBE64B